MAIAGLSRKDQLQMRREEAEAKRDGFVTGRGPHCLLAEPPCPKSGRPLCTDSSGHLLLTV
jgi:hypothetical protein